MTAQDNESATTLSTKISLPTGPELPGLLKADDDLLTITVLDSATIFNGPDSVYRYDLPGTGILDGWALPAVVDQTRQFFPLTWPDVEIIVDADERTAEVLINALVNKGAIAYPVTAMEDDELSYAATSGQRRRNEPAITRPEDEPTRRLSIFHIGIAAVVILAIAATWWFIDPTGSEVNPAAEPPRDDEIVVDEVEEPDHSPPPVDEGLPAEDEIPLQEHQVGNIRVFTPEGFTIEPRNGAWMLTGDDENLRIHLAADPIHQISEAEVLNEVAASVDSDPQLTLQSITETELVYRELNDDGSETTWSSWVADMHHFFVGCNTRQAPTMPQRATCRIVGDTLTLSD